MGPQIEAALRRQMPERTDAERLSALRRIVDEMRTPSAGDLQSFGGGILGRFRATAAGGDTEIALAEALVCAGIDPDTVRDVLGNHRAALDFVLALLRDTGWTIRELT